MGAETGWLQGNELPAMVLLSAIEEHKVLRERAVPLEGKDDDEEDARVALEDNASDESTCMCSPTRARLLHAPEASTDSTSGLRSICSGWIFSGDSSTCVGG